MTDATVAKKQRTTAKGSFTRKVNVISGLLETEADISEIEACFNDVEVAWKLVEQKHDGYLDALTEEDPSSEAWVEEVHQTYLGTRKSVLSWRSKMGYKTRCESAKRLFDIQQKCFTDMCASADKLMTSDCLPETLNGERLLIASQFERFKDAYSSYGSVLTEEDSKYLTADVTRQTERYNGLKVSFDKYITDKKKMCLVNRTPFRMEKMPLPKFDGVIRNYPQFKRDFHELVLPSVSGKESSYTLRQCLPREVNDYLGACNSDVTTMFNRLDSKYGDASKIVESIVAEIRTFKRPDVDDAEKIVKFIDLLETAYRDLKNLHLDSELTNTNTISIVENKLPKPIQME